MRKWFGIKPVSNGKLLGIFNAMAKRMGDEARTGSIGQKREQMTGEIRQKDDKIR